MKIKICAAKIAYKNETCKYFNQKVSDTDGIVPYVLIFSKFCLAIRNFCLSLHRNSLPGSGWVIYSIFMEETLDQLYGQSRKDVFERYCL